MAKRTLSIGPFILLETDRSRDLDWGEPDAKCGESADVGNQNE